MLVNSKLTIYHKTLDANTRLEKWTRYNYDNAWIYSGKGSSINKGYDNANDIEIRLPYDSNELDINDFAIGDIIVRGFVNTNIETQQDLSNSEVYNITSIVNNTYGNNPHIHIGGK